jgi:hypothetical protein
MTFQEAINEVVHNNKTVWRKSMQFDDDYDRPRNNGGDPTPWSEWKRIRMEEDHVDFDCLIYIEGNNQDDTTEYWFMEWTEDVLSKADILAEDWEIVEAKTMGEE